MCFKNLPIEFDAEGKPFLRAGVANPYGPTVATPRGAPAQLTAERIEELLKRNGYIKDLDFDPVTRVAGAPPLPPPGAFPRRQGLRGRAVGAAVRRAGGDHRGRGPPGPAATSPRAVGGFVGACIP